jgi:hypothetical protein
MSQRRPHDAAQRRLFAHPELIRMLIEGFIPVEITGELDLTRIEPLKDTFVSHGLAYRQADMVWKIPRRDGAQALYLCLLLELQSSIDPMMPIRILQCVSFIYENLARTNGLRLDANSLPPVLPVVLYNGSQRWGATTQLRELIASPQGSALSPYLTTLNFFLIDEGSFSDKQLNHIGNLLAQLFKLENTRNAAHIPRQLSHIITQLNDLLPAQLREDAALFISELLKSHDIIIPHHVLTAPKENNTMLADAIAKFKQQAITAGLKKGIKEGREQALRTMLGKQMGLRFGPDEARSATIAALSPDQLDLALTLILSADSERSMLDALHLADPNA